MPFGLWTRVGRRKHKFNCIRQVAPMCPPMWAHWHHLANTIEQSVCGGDAVLCQITLSTCSCMLPMSVVQSSSGILTISRIAYRGEGWQECTARANCNLRLRCCFYYVICMIKAAERFSYPFHMFVEMVSSLYGTITLENFCIVLKSSVLFSSLCPVEAPLKLNCRETSITEMSWFICHRFLWGFCRSCRYKTRMEFISTECKSWKFTTEFPLVFVRMKPHAMKFHGGCTMENPRRLCHQ